MDGQRRPTTMHSNPTRAMIIAWADAHSVDVSNAEADDLVRRLWYPPAPFDTEAVEKCVVDALLLLAEGEEHDESTAESLRGLAMQVSAAMLALRGAPDGDPDSIPSDGVTEREEAEDDGAPGTTVGEASGTPLRYDAIYIKPVAVTLNGKLAKAIWPPSYGRVKLQPEGSRRSLAVALDELDDRSRRMLRDAKVRLRTEMVVRCRAHCTQCFRAWMRPDGGAEDTKGEPISEFRSLFAARCERHRLTQ